MLLSTRDERVQQKLEYKARFCSTCVYQIGWRAHAQKRVVWSNTWVAKEVELRRKSIIAALRAVSIEVPMDWHEGRERTGWWSKLAKKRRKVYLFYVLVLLMIVYLINQMDRFILGIASRRISIDLEYGNLGCYANESHHNQTCNDSCMTYDVELRYCRRNQPIHAGHQYFVWS